MTPTAIPTLQNLCGAWQRRSVTLQGRTFSPRQDALWLQAGEHFADVRAAMVAPAPIDAFSGRIVLEDGVIAFNRDLLLKPAESEDRASLHLHGNILTERGVTLLDGKKEPYCEIWERLETPRSWKVFTAVSEGRVRARAVMINAICLLLVDQREHREGFAAARYQMSQSRWDRALMIGTAELPQQLTLSAEGLSKLSPRLAWTIVDES